MVEDAELLRRYAEEKSEAAFAELVKRHLDFVYSAALRRLGGDAHSAADVTQGVFTQLARQAASLSRCAVLPGWLYMTTRNIAVDFIRAEQRRRAREQKAHVMHELNAPPPSADWDQIRPLLDAAMDDLNPRDREAVLLRFFARRPFAEIGAALRLSEAAARMRVERALEKLQVRLARHGVTSTATALAIALETRVVGASPAGLATSVTSVASLAVVSPAGPLSLLTAFMANTKLTISGAALLVCLAGALSVRELSARHEAESALDAAWRIQETETADLRVLAKRVADAERDIAARATTAEPAHSEGRAAPNRTTSGAPATAAQTRPTPMQAGNAFLARHPAVKAALDAWGDAGVDGMWSAFYRSRGLTPQQIEEFRFLIRPRCFVPSEGSDGILLQLYTGAHFSQEEIDRRLRTLLGDEGFVEYQQRAERKLSRGAAGEVAGALSFSDTPITLTQYTQLIETLHQHRFGETVTHPPGRFNWEAVTRDAASFLSADQLNALETVRAHDAFQDLWDRAPNPLDAASKTATLGKQ